MILIIFPEIYNFKFVLNYFIYNLKMIGGSEEKEE